MRRHGKVNPVSVLLAIAIAGGVYYGYHVIPLYLDNLEVGGIITEHFNITFLQGPEEGKLKMMHKLNSMPGTWHYGVDDDGNEVMLPGLGLTDENVYFNMDGEVLAIKVNYTRTIEFLWTKKRKTYRFSAQKTGKRLK